MNYLKMIKTGLATTIILVSAGCLTSCSNWQPDSLMMLQKSPISEGQIRAQFFGNSTVLISDGKTSILVDGFLSRPNLIDVILKKLTSNESQIDKALIRGKVKKIDALLVAHSHYDHSLDAATVAKKTGAIVVGSLSTLKILQAENVTKERFHFVKHGDSLKIGSFEISFYETPHSPKPKFKGNINKSFQSPAKASAYKLGKSYSDLLRHNKGNVLIVPSANFIPGLFEKMNVKANVVFLGIGRLSKQPNDFIRNYWKEVVEATDAKVVIPIHWVKLIVV